MILTCAVRSVQRLQFPPSRPMAARFVPVEPSESRLAEGHPGRGVVLTLAAAGAHWAVGTGWGRGSGHGFLRQGLGDRRVRVARAPGLTSVRGTALAGSGDMMIDGVVPLGGVAAPVFRGCPRPG